MTHVATATRRPAAFLAALVGGLCLASAAAAQTAPEAPMMPSRCLAVAEAAPQAIAAAYLPVQAGPAPLGPQEVSIRFVGHATFLITSPQGVTIATDYTGHCGPVAVPYLLSMIRGHSSH
jgi:hypothetical protein